MDNDKKKKVLLIIGSLTLIIALLGSAYAFFTYFKSHEAYAITSLNIKAEFIEGTNSVIFQNAYPISDSFAISNLDKLTYIDFTVTSEISSESQAVEYEIYLEEDEGNTLDSSFVKVYLTDDNNKKVTGPSIYSELENTTYSNSYNGKVLYKDNNNGEITKNYRLYVWLDSSYEQNEVSQTFKFKVNLYAYNAENKKLSSIVKNSIAANTDESCNPIIEEDGIVYFSGTNDCVDFNYVWYSGKLWRITAIYPDGTMKMITDDMITTINWGATATVSDTDLTSAYSTSYMREWLNQEFLPTLYNYENIIDVDAGWYSITDSNSTPTKPTGEYTLTDPVGLLNVYEYYMAYKNASISTNYLNIGYYWWLITPYSSSNVHDVGSNGSLGIYSNPPSTSHGARPSVNLKSTVQLSDGTGTSEDPYRIKGDIEEATPNTTLLNTRISGEYVKLENDESSRMFRIVDKELVGENLTTKIVLNDYIKESNTVLTKYFSDSSSHELWSEVSATDTTYWRGYLNTTWLGTLDTSMLAKGTYYLGYQGSGSYKTTVCRAVSSDVGIKECVENGTVVSNISSDDYVGLLRVGEMFASQTRDNTFNNASYIWLITPSSSSYVRYVSNIGALYGNNPNSNLHGVRPTIHLKSEILIESGSGTKQDPFVVGLPS